MDSKADPENVLINQQLLPCPETSLLTSSLSSRRKTLAPLSFVLTEFHVLLLYSDHVKGVSLLNQELIFEDVYNDVSFTIFHKMSHSQVHDQAIFFQAFGRLVNITKDPTTGSIWAFSERAVFKYKVTREDRNVWEVYIEKGEFELAKQYCRDNPVHVDQVLVKQAEMLFKNKE